jgi:hypothetical protein
MLQTQRASVKTVAPCGACKDTSTYDQVRQVLDQLGDLLLAWCQV